jgi:hypothetical protein
MVKKEETEINEFLAKEKENIDRFYKVCFGVEVPWKPVLIPIHESLQKPEYIFSDITEFQILKKYGKIFGEQSVDAISFANMIFEKTDNKSFKKNRRNRVIMHADSIKPDTVFETTHPIPSPFENVTHMNAREALIAAFRKRFETKELYDPKESVTQLNFTSIDGYPAYLYHKHGVLHIRRNIPPGRNLCGIRQLCL